MAPRGISRGMHGNKKCYWLRQNPMLSFTCTCLAIRSLSLSRLLPLSILYCTTQATNLKVCSVAEDLQKKLKKFRFRKEKNNAAIVSK